jgi:hypothetical protein
VDAPVAARDAGPAVELDVAGDLARHALPLAPLLIGLSAAVWGWAGALSAGYAVALVVANFLLAAFLMSWSARISLAFMMGVVLIGYALRLGLIFVAVYAITDTWWFEPWPLGLTLIVTHLGLLFWETRHVSASLAFPGLRPPDQPSPAHATKESRR